jgi:hypothetical protein
MDILTLKKRYIFNENEDSLYLETDYEVINLSTNILDRIFDGYKDLIRFITDEYEDLFPLCDEIHPFYFLSTHYENLIDTSLKDEKIISELKNFYPEEMIQSFQEIGVASEMKPIVPNKLRAIYSTSFFGIIEPNEEITIEMLIESAQKLKVQIRALSDYKIAIGNIDDNCGLLEIGMKEKTEKPTSYHFNFWKDDEIKSGISFWDISKNFRIIG